MWCAAAARAFMRNSIPYLLTGAQHTLRAWIVHVDRELFHRIIASGMIGCVEMPVTASHMPVFVCFWTDYGCQLTPKFFPMMEKTKWRLL